MREVVDAGCTEFYTRPTKKGSDDELRRYTANSGNDSITGNKDLSVARSSILGRRIRQPRRSAG